MNDISQTRIDLMRDSAKALPLFESPSTVVAARIWHCKYKTLLPLCELINLEELEIATVPDASLDFLRRLKKLRFLSILHLPKITNIDPLSELAELETLCLSTSPGWDSSGKKTMIETLRPLRLLTKLKHLELTGVVPSDESLADVAALPSLKTLSVMAFAKDERDAIFARGVEDRSAPMSSFHARR